MKWVISLLLVATFGCASTRQKKEAYLQIIETCFMDLIQDNRVRAALDSGLLDGLRHQSFTMEILKANSIDMIDYINCVHKLQDF